MARVINTRYVEAPPGEPWKTADEMTELCCEPTGELQCEEEKIGVYNGPTDEEILAKLGITIDANGRDQDGRRIRIKRRERSQPCGKIIRRYKVEQLDCCEEVAELVYDADNSVDILSPGTSGVVRFTGGRLPVTVQVRGNGFSLDGYNQRDGLAYSRAFWVYAHEMACGQAPINIDDGCTVVQGSVRSTVGRWDGVCLAWGNVNDRYYTNYRRNYNILTGFSDCGIPEFEQVAWGPFRYCTTFVGQCFHWYNNSTWLRYWSFLNYIPIEDFDAIYDHLTGLGWGEEVPNDYAPNGPGDLAALGLPLCSPSGQVCRFIC